MRSAAYDPSRMKRALSFFLCICLLLLFPLPVAAEEELIPIASSEDLLRIAARPDGHYELTDDIDMAGVDWTPIPFSGTLNGNGHAVYNLTVDTTGADEAETYDGNSIRYDTVFGGLFSIVTDAEIRDLQLQNCTVRVETDRHCFIGSIAGYAARTSFSGCSVTCRNHLTISSVNAGVGGIAGFCHDSVFEDCRVDAELVFTDVNPDVLCEEFMGGVYASGCASILRATIRLRGYSEIYGYAHNGGAVGMFKLTRDLLKKRFKLVNTVSDAEITFFEITPSRRAYCDPLIGENLGGNCYLTKNEIAHFASFESKEPVRLSPEQCGSPRYTAEFTAPTADEWGYCTYTCEICGYTYRDRYTRDGTASVFSQFDPSLLQTVFRNAVIAFLNPFSPISGAVQPDH